MDIRRRRPQDINVHGTIVKPDGTRLEIDKNAIVTPNIGEPIITVKKNSDLDYTFTTDMSDTGIRLFPINCVNS